MARNYYQRNDDGCGCWILIAITILVLIVGGIRGCINGDIRLPRSGSSHVSGGSGHYGTSNGANIQYPQTTSPNFNSSSNDYSDMPQNSSSGHRNSSSSKANETSSGINSSSHNQISPSTSSQDGYNNYPSLNNHDNSSNRNSFAKCSSCNGKGYTEHTFVYDPNDGLTASLGAGCGECSRTDRHSHIIREKCFVCHGTGKQN